MSEEVMSALTPVIVALLTTILTGIVGYLGVVAKRLADASSVYLINKIGHQNYDLLRKISKDAVLNLIQSPAFKDLTGAEKKEIALVKINDYLRNYNIRFSHEQMSEMIEAVYAEISSVVVFGSVE